MELSPLSLGPNVLFFLLISLLASQGQKAGQTGRKQTHSGRCRLPESAPNQPDVPYPLKSLQIPESPPPQQQLLQTWPFPVQEGQLPDPIQRRGTNMTLQKDVTAQWLLPQVVAGESGMKGGGVLLPKPGSRPSGSAAISTPPTRRQPASAHL